MLCCQSLSLPSLLHITDSIQHNTMPTQSQSAILLSLIWLHCFCEACAFLSQTTHHPTRVALSATDQQSQSETPSSSFLTFPLTQVVSDIDDTLKSSGGVTIAGVSLGGIDVQYARGEFYPGVFQFMWELSLYSITLNQQYYDDFTSEEDDSSLLQGLTPPKVAVLTARAEEFKAALEIKDESKLAQAFLKTGESSEVCPTKNWGVGPVLYGSVNEWIVQYKKGLRKFNNFERLLEQDPTGRILQVCRCDCVVSCPLWSISFALSLTLFCPLAQYTTTHLTSVHLCWGHGRTRPGSR